MTGRTAVSARPQMMVRCSGYWGPVSADIFDSPLLAAAAALHAASHASIECEGEPGRVEISIAARSVSIEQGGALLQSAAVAAAALLGRPVPVHRHILRLMGSWQGCRVYEAADGMVRLRIQLPGLGATVLYRPVRPGCPLEPFQASVTHSVSGGESSQQEILWDREAHPGVLLIRRQDGSVVVEAEKGRLLWSGGRLREMLVLEPGSPAAQYQTVSDSWKSMNRPAGLRPAGMVVEAASWT